MKIKVLVGSAALLALIGLFFAGCSKDGGSAPQGRVELSYYKLFDDEDVMQPLILDYQKTHPNVTIKYRKFTNVEEYEDLILNEMAEGEGPDIFEVSNTGLPRFYKKIFPLEATDFTPQMMEQNFLSVAVKDFVKNDFRDGKLKIYGVPLSVDVPVVYYNKEIFERKLPEKGKPAETWDGLVDDVYKLREEDSQKQLLKGGIAMGRSDNIAGAVDILMNLMLQESVQFYDADLKKASFSRGGDKALEFFASFGDPQQKQYSWSGNMVSAEEAFLSGKTAMVIGYSDMHQNFEVNLKNLKAKGFDVVGVKDIGIAPLPQKSAAIEDKKVFSKYYAESVSRNAKRPDAAWDLIIFMTQQKQAKEYAKKSGKPASRRDLLEEQKKDPVSGVFVSELGYAEGIPMFHELKYRELFSDAIQKTAAKTLKPSQALREAENAINSFLPEKGLFPKYIPGATTKKKVQKN